MSSKSDGEKPTSLQGVELGDVPCTQPERSREASWENLHSSWVLEAGGGGGGGGKVAIASILVIQTPIKVLLWRDSADVIKIPNQLTLN